MTDNIYISQHYTQFCSNALSEATPQKKEIEIDIANADTIPGDIGSVWGERLDKAPESPVARPKSHSAKQTSPVASTASLPSSYGSNASVCWRKFQ